MAVIDERMEGEVDYVLMAVAFLECYEDICIFP